MSHPRTREGITGLVRDTLAAQPATSGGYGDAQYTAEVMAVIGALCDGIGARTPAPPADHEGDLLAVIRAELAGPDWAPESDTDPAVTHVLITTTEWDNGYFYDTSGTAIYSDGSIDPIDLDAAEDTLTELAAEGGQLGSQAGILVRLADGHADFEDYISTLTDPLIKREDPAT